MKAQFRRLPHINQLYQRRKSYQLHLKKINSIKLAKDKLKHHLSFDHSHDINHQRIRQHQRTRFQTQPFQQIKNNQSLLKFNVKYEHSHEQRSQKNSYKLPNIHQLITNHHGKNKKWKCPYQKRVQQQMKAENIRLKKRVKSTQVFHPLARVNHYQITKSQI